MLIGPIYHTTSNPLYAVLIHLGPGANQGKAWNHTDKAWETLFTSFADETMEMLVAVWSGSAWRMAHVAVPGEIPATQKCRAMIFEQVGASPDAENDVYLETINVGDPGRAAIGEHRLIADAFVFRLGRRWDGTVEAINTICVRPGEIVAGAFDADKLLPKGVFIASISDLNVSPPGGLAVNRLNDSSILGTQAKFEVDATNGVDATDYTVTCTLTTDQGDQVEAEGTIECRE